MAGGKWRVAIPMGHLHWFLEAGRNAFHIGQIINKMRGSRLDVQAEAGSLEDPGYCVWRAGAWQVSE